MFMLNGLKSAIQQCYGHRTPRRKYENQLDRALPSTANISRLHSPYRLPHLRRLHRHVSGSGAQDLDLLVGLDSAG